MTYLLDDALEIAREFLLITVGNRSELCVVALSQHIADKQLICSDFAFGSFVQLRDITINLLWIDWHRVLVPVACQNHQEMTLGLHAEIGLDGRLEGLAICLLICFFNRTNIGVGASQENIVQDRLLCTNTVHGIVKKPDILLQWPADCPHQTLLEPATDLALDIGDQLSIELAGVCLTNCIDLQSILICQNLDQSLLICTKTLHCLPQTLGIPRGIILYVLSWTVA